MFRKFASLFFAFFSLQTALFAQQPGPVHYSSSYHALISGSLFGEEIRIEDGSLWKVIRKDQLEASKWLYQDTLTVTQNNAWFPDTKYRLVNHNRRTSVAAELIEGPIINGDYTRTIHAFDPYTGIIQLNDSTRWEVCPYDTSEFRQWNLEDPIIVGFNSGWHSARYDGLLINVSRNEFVRARRY